MSANTKKRASERGFTLPEIVVTVTLVGLLIGPVIVGTFFFYSSMIVSGQQTQLAVESQSILHATVEELRAGSGVRDTNLVADAYAPPEGWNTSNDNLVLIIATPALNDANDFIINPLTGEPYQNEIIYYASENTLYKRYLAHPDAVGNKRRTTCPAANASSTCPADVVLSENFKTMNFVFYDQDNIETSDLNLARSIKLLVSMERRDFGRAINYDNNIRITIRNST